MDTKFILTTISISLATYGKIISSSSVSDIKLSFLHFHNSLHKNSSSYPFTHSEMNALLRICRQTNLFNNIISDAKYIQRFYAKNKDSKCDVDRCGCPLPKEKSNKPYEIVKEKSCKPCSFWAWKPKVPKLGNKVEEPCAKKYRKKPPPEPKPRKCFAGMKEKKKPTLRDHKKRAAECQASINPKKPFCPPKKVIKKEKKVKKECPDKYPIPRPDWQPECKS